MKEITFKKVHDSGKQRFYECNQPLLKGKSTFIDIDITEEMAKAKENTKDEYKQFIPTECKMICISDATSHAERLVFTACKYKDDNEWKYGRLSAQIGGTHTMMIHGGDVTSMKDDVVYMRILAKLNGYKLTNKLNQ